MMDTIGSFNFQFPVRLLFGWGRFSELGVEAARLGRRALVVTTGRLFEQTGLAGRAARLLAEAGVEHSAFADVSPNPLTDEIDAGAAEAKARGVDVVLALGGGSAIDAAKGIAVAAGHDRPIWSFADPARRAGLGERMLPLIAVPTTAGTGSEVTQYIVVTHKASRRKPGIASNRTYPAAAIVDARAGGRAAAFDHGCLGGRRHDPRHRGLRRTGTPTRLPTASAAKRFASLELTSARP